MGDENTPSTSGVDALQCAICAADEPDPASPPATSLSTEELQRVYAARAADCEWEEANAPWFLWHYVRYHGYRWWG